MLALQLAVVLVFILIGARLGGLGKMCIRVRIGAGQIGTAMAQRCKAFGMDVFYAQEHPMREPARSELDAKGLSVDELVAHCDVISLHCPLTPETHHIINAERLASMKQGSYLINTARGACVDEKALVAALQSGHLGGAGLDVYEHEPAIEPELLTMENVCLLYTSRCV